MTDGRDQGEELLSYAEGRASTVSRRQIREHLATCASCRAWLESYRLLEATLTAGAAVADQHPSADDLARLASGFPAEGEPGRARLEGHLASCAACRKVVTLSREAIERARGPRSGRGRRDRAHTVRRRRWAMAAGIVGLLIAGAVAEHRLRGVQGSLLLSNSQLTSGDHLVRARTSIQATDVRLESGAQVTFRAGKSVAFGEGFSVASDATLAVQIGDPPGDS